MNFNFEYELIDSGGFQRIERFGSFVLARPCPQAHWKRVVTDIALDAEFIKKGEKGTWNILNPELPEAWEIQVGTAKAIIKLSPNSQVGIFPEQQENWEWLNKTITTAEQPLKILNTFAYTGMATLNSSTNSNEVTHVDGAKSAINWAKKNAESSNLQQNKIRWICDDVIQFMEKEIRRGNTYDGIIMDPPAFGRGGKREWKIERDLPLMMQLVPQILSPNPAFVILTCHASKLLEKKNLGNYLNRLHAFAGRTPELRDLNILSSQGNALPSSFGARIYNL